MLAFVMCGEHQYTVRDVLESRINPFEACVTILSYREFLTFDQLPVAEYIFSDFERLHGSVIEAVGKRLEELRCKRPSVRALNTPDVGLRRQQVSERLHAAGINRFRVALASDIPADLRFPVFVRRLDDHNGPVTGLLHSYGELHAALAGVEGDRASNADLAVTEFVDTRNNEGRFEKMSYFRVGDKFFPGALNASPNWVCKGVARDDESEAMKERRMRFLTGNPHEAMMRQVFKTAGVEYGRADYAMVDGRPQVFEINTNPMIVRPELLPPEKRIYPEIVLANWFEALAAFSAPSRKASPVWAWVPRIGEVEVPASAGRLGRRMVHRILTITDQLHRETAVMRALRARI